MQYSAHIHNPITTILKLILPGTIRKITPTSSNFQLHSSEELPQMAPLENVQLKVVQSTTVPVVIGPFGKF